MSPETFAIVGACAAFVSKVGIDACVKIGLISAGPVAEAAAERADRAEKELERAETRLKQQDTRIASLEAKTDIRPLISLVEQSAKLQQQTVDKLADMNGGMRAATAALETTNHALAQTTEAVKFAASELIRRKDWNE